MTTPGEPDGIWSDLAQHAQVDRNLTNHPLTAAQIVLVERIRATARSLAHEIVDDVPPGRERSTSITNLEQAVMYAVAGIARSNAPGAHVPADAGGTGE